MTLSTLVSQALAGVPMAAPHPHGGPDALGVPRHDFSTNSNACGPCAQAVAALQACDASHYPDPNYTVLRQQIAGFHQVDASRIVLAGSASEFIFRITAWVAGQGGQQVCVPPHSYGDYAQAAQAWGMALTRQPDEAQLVWCCEPSSPLGGPQACWPDWIAGPRAADRDGMGDGALAVAQLAPVHGPASACEVGRALPAPTPVVLDCAYAPLRLSGVPTLTDAQRNRVWQLWTPNKALGLTGVRAAYVIAPRGAEAAIAALNRLCPSWPLGTHGVALLQAWVQPEVQTWLAQSLIGLRGWKARQISLLEGLGWTCLPSEANFFCARPPDVTGESRLGDALARLRRQGIKLRDATSFGLPGHVRLSVQPPEAQLAMATAWQAPIPFSDRSRFGAKPQTAL